MEVDAEAAVTYAPFETLRILKLVKDAQQKHGLRHGNYKRYGDYCGRRMQRLRKALKYTHQHKCVPKHRAKFTYKTITADAIVDPRFLELLVYNVEQCWARGMDFKVGSEDEAHARQKFHARTRLLKALKHARDLDTMLDNSPRIDSLTKLETKAYNAYIAGTFHLEKQSWADALENYKQSKKIYEKLLEIDRGSEFASYYDGRCRELTQMIKLCEYNRGDGASSVTPEMIRLNLSETGTELNIDKLIDEAQSPVTTGGKSRSIKWAGTETYVTHSAVTQVLESIEKADSQKQTMNADEKIAVYEKCQADLRDAVQKFNEEKAKTKLSELQQRDCQIISTYLDFLRNKLAAERYILLAANLSAEKKSKPQAYLRLYAEVIEDSDEILKLPGAESDAALQAAFRFKSEFYTAIKCFHMAGSYGALGQETEAVRLFDRALERQQASAKL